ncbi:hypothetical protein Taro_018033 [Colocasia esculenta]|uniref:Bulb-type lectin domain-containing protein n=1 Tax=Colocasia esculenta TaxID=4460 RepID=A0A843USU7_COLES|nr:hypothetical protein [Colocasia esculenta]
MQRARLSTRREKGTAPPNRLCRERSISYKSITYWQHIHGSSQQQLPPVPLVLLAVPLGLLSSPVAADEVLPSGQSLAPGQSLTNCGVTLSMQTDCALVLYDNGNAVWSSGTYGQGSNCQLSMQSDGNLVIYSNGNAVWASNTQRGDGNYVLVLQRDRNLVIYGSSIWATDTSRVAVAGARNAVKDHEASAGDAVVVNAKSIEGEPGLGRKINMVTNEA